MKIPYLPFNYLLTNIKAEEKSQKLNFLYFSMTKNLFLHYIKQRQPLATMSAIVLDCTLKLKLKKKKSSQEKARSMTKKKNKKNNTLKYVNSLHCREEKKK